MTNEQLNTLVMPFLAMHHKMRVLFPYQQLSVDKHDATATGLSFALQDVQESFEIFNAIFHDIIFENCEPSSVHVKPKAIGLLEVQP